MDVQGVPFDAQGKQHSVVATPCGAESEQFVREGLPSRWGLSARGMVTNSRIAAAAFGGSRRKPLIAGLVTLPPGRIGGICAGQRGGRPTSRRRSAPLVVLLPSMSQRASSRSSRMPGCDSQWMFPPMPPRWAAARDFPYMGVALLAQAMLTMGLLGRCRAGEAEREEPLWVWVTRSRTRVKN
jgi:hypothetical protein